MTSAIIKLHNAMRERDSLVCCGLDPDIQKIPTELKGNNEANSGVIIRFLREIIKLAAPHVCAFKIQKAFFDVLPDGHEALGSVIGYLHRNHPELPVFVDCKIGDIDNTMEAYLANMFKTLNADGVVVNPYMGDDVLAPFSKYPNQAAIVLVRTSNPGAHVVQDLILASGKPLWEEILAHAVAEWNAAGNVIAVLSSTSKNDLSQVRSLIPDSMPVLLAGFGAQGGGLQSLKCLLDSRGAGVFINSSRGLLYPYHVEDPSWRSKVNGAIISMKTEINKGRR